MGFQLISNDKYIFDIDDDLCKRCGLLQNMKDYCKNNNELDELDEPAAIPFSGKIMSKIVDYCTYYKNTSVKSYSLEEVLYNNDLVEITDWDLDFCKDCDIKMLKNMCGAAQFLLCEELSYKIGKIIATTRILSLSLEDKIKIIEMLEIPIDDLPEHTQEILTQQKGRPSFVSLVPQKKEK